MRKLVLFGDSNTYGYDPRGFMGGRYPEEVRWTTKVKEALSDSYEVIEEGMNGRQLPDVKYGIDAFDASTWNILMGYDGVHFSVEGHKKFGEKMLGIFD